MLIDLNEVDKLPLGSAYDVCICGAGPAGITLARALADAGKRVAVLEGGGLDYSDLSQGIYKGKSVGQEYWDGVANYRLRYFGGTSNHWGGRCSYFDAVDFEARAYHTLPGWPIPRQEVTQWMDAAQNILDISKEKFAANKPEVVWKGNNFRYSDYAFSPPTRFKGKYLEELKASKKIDVYINSNLVNINLNDQLSSVTSLELKNYNKKNFTFIAAKYVLALGAIENARILLNCDKQVRGGIGNHSDFVGRCFMEHLNVEIGRFIADDMGSWKHGSLQLNPLDGFIKQKNIGNGVLAFDANPDIQSYGRMKVFKKFIRENVCKSEIITDASRKVMDFSCPGDGVLTSLIEQTPNRDSRVTLDSERDVLGLRRVILDWKLNADDQKTIRTLGLEAAKEMARTGVARVQLKKFILDESEVISALSPHAHHMGTTRMSDDPRYGVVDRNLRIHGIQNFYIAGSSVFPTGGGCNPTFTVVMMALRLANHLLHA